MLKSIYSILYNNRKNKFYIILIIGNVVCNYSYAKGRYTTTCKMEVKKDSLLTVKAQADSLKKYGDLILHSTGGERTKYERLFFKYFPDTFARFDSLYGYKEVSPDSAVYMPLYDSSHLDTIFPNLDSIDKTIFYKKLINVSIGGHWDSDQVDVLQHDLIEKVRSHVALTEKILKTYNDDKIKSFWLFFFDMENPSAVDWSFLKKLKNQRIILLMDQARKIDKEKWSH